MLKCLKSKNQTRYTRNVQNISKDSSYAENYVILPHFYLVILSTKNEIHKRKCKQDIKKLSHKNLSHGIIG